MNEHRWPLWDSFVTICRQCEQAAQRYRTEGGELRYRCDRCGWSHRASSELLERKTYVRNRADGDP